MTYQPPANWAPPTPPAKKRKGPLTWILGGIAVILLLCVSFAAIGALTTDDPTDTAAPPAIAATTAAGKQPKPADFTLTAKVTEQTCYGEAGCAVTWIPEVAYTGPVIEGGQVWTVAYEVSGIESGTSVGTIVVGSTGPAKQREKRARTDGKDREITLKVTRVEEA